MRILDLFCGAGGAAMGLHRAWPEAQIMGIDIKPQPRYPFKFFQADVMDNLYPLAFETFDLIWASPPCQAYSPLNAYNHKRYDDLVALTRTHLQAAGVPYIIENVVQAPLRNPSVLCGSMFGLSIYRHRGFETSFPVQSPEHPVHVATCARNGYLPQHGQFMTISGGKHSRAWQRAAADAMDVPWMETIREVCEAIPPAYSEYIARQVRL